MVFEQIVQKETESKSQAATTMSHFGLFSTSELQTNAQLVWGREFRTTTPLNFIEKLWTQIPKPVHFEPLNNQYINYVRSSTCAIHVPSQFYVFSDVGQFDNLKYEVDPSMENKGQGAQPAECGLGMNSGDMADTLRLLQQIEKYQNISITNLCMVDVKMKEREIAAGDTLPFNALKLNKKMKYFRVVNCSLVHTLYNHLMRELSACDDLHHLDLSRTKGLPLGITHALQTMKNLRYLDLSEVNMAPDMSQEVMSALCHCKYLMNLYLAGNTLTNVIGNLLCHGDTGHPTFPDLQELYLQDTRLSADDMKSLSMITRGSKLKLLNISNNCLTDCIEALLSESDFPELGQLEMRNGQLCKTDITSLSKAVHQKKLLKLKALDVTGNLLTDCMAELVGERSHPGFPCLKEVVLKQCGLNGNDLNSLGCAVSEGKIPSLELLYLSKNNLTGCLGKLLGIADCHLFLSLEYLQLENAKLSGSDIAEISAAISSEQLPRLDQLVLTNNNLHAAEEATEDLVETYLFRFKKTARPHTLLSLNSLSNIFQKEKLSKTLKGSLEDVESWLWGRELYCSRKGEESECSLSIQL